MGPLKTSLDSKGITAKQVVTTSRRIETWDAESRTLLVKRVGKRRNKELAAKKYAELNIGKPAQMGRGVSGNQVAAALADQAVPRKIRSKIFRAVNAILTKKGQPAAEFKALFEGTTAKAGKKPKDAKKTA